MALSLSGDGTLSGVDIAASGLGKVLQVVRTSDSTQRSTTSNSYIDVPGMSVSITPQLATSAIVVIAVVSLRAQRTSAGTAGCQIQITDSLDNPISGAQDSILQTYDATQVGAMQTLFGYVTPSTTSTVTYKLRYRTSTSGITLYAMNNLSSGQMYAIEVAA